MSAPERLLTPAMKLPDVVPPAATVKPATEDPYASWLDRMQRARMRHAAITRNLYTWSNYKNWADRMKDSWDEPPAKPAK